MKKAIVLALVVIAGAGGWWAYSSHVQGIKRSVLGDPARAVTAFMDTAVKVNNLMWDEKEKQNVRELLKDLEEGKTEEARATLQRYQIEDPASFFKEEEFGRAALSAICIFEFESFSVKEEEVRDDTATVAVEFVPSDVFAIRKTVAKLGVPQAEAKKEPVVVVFHLERRRHRWQIVDVGGELKRPIEAIHTLRRYR